MEQSNIEIYLAAIEREQKKRATTYPKILQKAKKQGMSDDEFDQMLVQQHAQNRKLANAVAIINARQNLHLFHPEFVRETLGELVRELEMRKKCYSFFIWKKRMTKEAAAAEQQVWQKLCLFFKKEILEKCASSSSSI